MNQDELIDAIRGREPFLPVWIHLSNGATYDVTHPDGIMIGENVAAIAVGNNIALVSMRHINEIVPITTHAAR